MMTSPLMLPVTPLTLPVTVSGKLLYLIFLMTSHVAVILPSVQAEISVFSTHQFLQSSTTIKFSNLMT